MEEIRREGKPAGVRCSAESIYGERDKLVSIWKLSYRDSLVCRIFLAIISNIHNKNLHYRFGPFYRWAFSRL